MTTITLPDWLADMTVADVLGVFLLLVTVYVLIRKIYPISRRFMHLIDDLGGEAARPGVPARPGLMERVASVEQASHETRERLETVETATSQLLRNGGSRLADAAYRVEATQREDAIRAGRDVVDIPPRAPRSHERPRLPPRRLTSHRR